jgi:hypothetical protein
LKTPDLAKDGDLLDVGALVELIHGLAVFFDEL